MDPYLKKRTILNATLLVDGGCLDFGFGLQGILKLREKIAI